MTISVWDYRRELKEEKAEVYEAFEKVLNSGRLILGESVRTFEERFARYCDARFGIGVGNGTDALFLALKALGVGPGDDVVTVPNTAVPTVSAIASTGARARFVDVDPQTYLMDVAALERAITPQTKVLLPVHLYGQCVDMDVVRRVAAARGLKILEDCAQAHGALYGKTKAGGMSDASAFSFYPTKILGGYGDAGMVVTSDETVAAKMKRLRFYGMEKTYYSVEHGYNSRLDELHAEILLRKLPRLDGYVERRRAIARRYDAALAGLGLALPQEAPHRRHAYYLYVCRHPRRDFIIAELQKRDIVVNVSYPWPIHTMPAYASLGYKEGDFPHAEAAAREIFSLPMYPSLTDAEQTTVIDALRDILTPGALV
jgi:dTDP-3-amino-2,3,6-trideoxy-4-keto-D-glucose/dTDP-3-amino-3,4,6-trideoxy-alpha-D-glucose/dTDP-2,6-dideoxy-D-kanosamine transaminase